MYGMSIPQCSKRFRLKTVVLRTKLSNIDTVEFQMYTVDIIRLIQKRRAQNDALESILTSCTAGKKFGNKNKL